ncbi:pentatricopeptide repeat-containing protein At4g21300-like [Elaeis guineensis]|uniref:pentatricopeptide repeat-containing protein At4g21300-like n=1 Tax=Elaeis guineensis var. tenera TaxID=51953 RepID=UPI003C6D0C78
MAFFPAGFRLSTRKILPLVPSRFHPRKASGFHEEELAFQELCTAERFAFCLCSCSDIRSLGKLHACILAHGFGDNIYLGSKLLNLYASFGGLPESQWVFRKIINRNLSLWNSAIVGYFRASYFEEVLCLYLNLKSQGIGMDSPAITFGLKSCIEFGNVEFGRGIHVDAFKFGLNGDKFVGSSLVGLYFSFQCMEDARQAFEEILDKDVIAYTAMITGHAQLSDFQSFKAFEIASDMQREGLDANRVTLVSLLQAAGKSEALKEGQSVHCYALRREIGHSDEVFQTSLVDMYARCGARTAAASVLRQMERRSVASWNALIAGLIHHGQNSEALKNFSLMQQEGNISPDSITLANVLSACSDLNYTHFATRIHGYLIRRDIPLDIVLTTALIEMYSKCNKTTRARELFDQLIMRDVILYNVMISGYLQNHMINEATILFGEMVKAGVRPNSATVLSMLSTFANLADIISGKWIHGFVVRYCLQTDVDVSNQILHMYAKCGRIDIARTTFNSIAKKDLVSWTALMMGYVNYGHADEALALFQLMQQTGEKPDTVTITTLLQALPQLGCLEPVKEIHGYIYRTCLEKDTATMNSIINAYAKCGRLDTSEAVFNNMTERGLTSWNTMITAYGMHGYCKEVLELFNQMQKENLKPDELTFTSVLSACSHAGLVEAGWRVFNSISYEHSITPQEEHYGCMVDLLGRAGQLEEAYNFVKGSPLRDKVSASCALLAGCRIHRNTKLGEVIGSHLLDLEPMNSGTYSLVSNVYAQAGKWSEAANLRSIARERGLRKIPGYSLIELEEHVCGI